MVRLRKSCLLNWLSLLLYFSSYSSSYCLINAIVLFHLYQLLKFDVFTSKLESQPLIWKSVTGDVF